MRKCDSCQKLTMSDDLTKEECLAVIDLQITPNYAEQRMNNNESKCAGYKKLRI